MTSHAGLSLPPRCRSQRDRTQVRGGIQQYQRGKWIEARLLPSTRCHRAADDRIVQQCLGVERSLDIAPFMPTFDKNMHGPRPMRGVVRLQFLHQPRRGGLKPWQPRRQSNRNPRQRVQRGQFRLCPDLDAMAPKVGDERAAVTRNEPGRIKRTIARPQRGPHQTDIMSLTDRFTRRKCGWMYRQHAAQQRLIHEPPMAGGVVEVPDERLAFCIAAGWKCRRADTAAANLLEANRPLGRAVQHTKLRSVS